MERRELITVLTKLGRSKEAAWQMAHEQTAAIIRKNAAGKPPAKRSGKDVERIVEATKDVLRRAAARYKGTNDENMEDKEDDSDDEDEEAALLRIATPLRRRAHFREANEGHEGGKNKPQHFHYASSDEDEEGGPEGQREEKP